MRVRILTTDLSVFHITLLETGGARTALEVMTGDGPLPGGKICLLDLGDVDLANPTIELGKPAQKKAEPPAPEPEVKYTHSDADRPQGPRRSSTTGTGRSGRRPGGPGRIPRSRSRRLDPIPEMKKH